MKLLSWAHKKLLPSSANLKSTTKHAGINVADRLFENSAESFNDRHQSTIASSSGNTSSHADQVLTIGTLGMGSLLTKPNPNPSDEEEDEITEYDDDDDEEADDQEEELAHNVTPNYDESPNNNCRESMSSNGTLSDCSMFSSNRESVSSVDMQRLQEELHKILYSKLPAGAHELSSKSEEEGGGGKARSKKQKSKAADDPCSASSCAEGRSKKQKRKKSSALHELDRAQPGRHSHVRAREMLPLQKFLEFPMDEATPPTGANFVVQKKQYYQLLMQSLTGKLLHYASPTRVRMGPSLYEKLIKPKLPLTLQQAAYSGSKVDKLLQMVRRVVRKRQGGGLWRTRRKGSGVEEEDMDNNNGEDACKKLQRGEDEEGEEEELLKWAVTRSCRGSERFIEYMASKLVGAAAAHDQIQEADQQQQSMAQVALSQHILSSNGPARFTHPRECDPGVQRRLLPAAAAAAFHPLIMPSSSSSSAALAHECWIRTDDEYLVLEL